MLQKELTYLFDQFNKRKIKYCILGGEDLPTSISGSDIDILVNIIDSDVDSLLRENGYKKSKSVQIFRGSPAVYCKYMDKIGWIPIHVIERKINNYEIAPKNFNKYLNLKKRLYFAIEELYLYVTISHSIVKKSISQKRIDRVNSIVNDSNFKHHVFQDIIKHSSSDYKYIINNIYSKKFENIEKLISVNDLPNVKCSVYKRIEYILRNRLGLTMEPGCVLALEGLDGSGKSTFIKNLNNTVRKKNRDIFIIKSMAGRGFYPIIRKFRSIWRSSCDKTDIISLLLKNILVPFVFVIELFSCYSIYIHTQFKKHLGYNIIFDRYTYLHYIRQKAHNKNKFILKGIYIHLLYTFTIKYFPMPDKIIFFNIDPQLAYERKKEDELKDLEYKYDIYVNEILPKINNDKLEIYEGKNEEKVLVNNFLNAHWENLL